MKFWTIQSKDVVETICNKELFQPDFNKSRYLTINANLKGLYDFVLKSYNDVNETDLPGIVFAFTQSNGLNILPIDNIDDFQSFMKNKKAVIDGFWNKLNKDNVVLMELEYKENFNPIYLDINDFQYLMPPIYYLPLYPRNSEMTIKSNIAQGLYALSPLPSSVIQAHLPCITKENIVNIYPVFPI